jgi:hypothetical protein
VTGSLEKCRDVGLRTKSRFRQWPMANQIERLPDRRSMDRQGSPPPHHVQSAKSCPDSVVNRNSWQTFVTTSQFIYFDGSARWSLPEKTLVIASSLKPWRLWLDRIIVPCIFSDWWQFEHWLTFAHFKNCGEQPIKFHNLHSLFISLKLNSQNLRRQF